MRMIHCADLHLDSKMTANLPKEKIKTRKIEILHTFLRMVEYAKKNQVDAILIAGDMFDTKSVSASTKNAVYQAINSNPQIAFFYLKGNHDADSFLANLDQVPKNLHLFTDRWTYYKLDKLGRIVVAGLELSRENGETFYHSLDLPKECFNIVMLHGQESEYKGKDQTEVIPLRELKDRSIDYLALGHIHEHKEGRLDARGIWCYSGCLEGRGFDECGEHGFVLLDIDWEGQRCTRQFVPFAYRKLYTVSIDISGSRSLQDVINAVKNTLADASYEKESLIKIVLTGQIAMNCDISVEWLKRQVEDAFYFVKIEDRSTFSIQYEEFILDPSLKGEFVRSVMADGTLSEVEKAEVIRYGIQALAGEEL